MSVFKFTVELQTSQVYKWGGSGGNTVWDTLQMPVSEKREMLGKLPCHQSLLNMITLADSTNQTTCPSSEVHVNNKIYSISSRISSW